jgi:amino acid adenylation domain-containing protein
MLEQKISGTTARLAARPEGTERLTAGPGGREAPHELVDDGTPQARLPRLSIDYPSRFEAQVERTPDRVAVSLYGPTVEALTYRELNERANRLAHLLRARGAGPEMVVGLLLERSIEMVVAMIAVQKAGAVCMPIEPSCSDSRLGSMLEDARAAMVVTCAFLAPRVARVPRVLLDGEALSEYSRENPIRSLTPDHAVQVMFTSGSTGRPKGVCLTHRGLMNFLDNMIARPGMDESDVILSLANYTFDPSIVEIYQPLLVGARCIVVPREVAVDGMALWACVRKTLPTILNATPATFKMLIEAGWEPRFPNMKLICGGETMSPSLAEQLLARSLSVWNVYGPTETTALCSIHEVREVEDPIPIGSAMPGCTLDVLDEGGRPVADGQPGELCIGGLCVTRGYMNREDLTREKFVADSAGGRLYRSGDLARRRVDGVYELLGRIDDQVKINGYRIELSAIESVLERHPAVREAVVLPREVGDERLLVACVVVNPGTEVEDDELRGWVAATLPSYMVPALLIRLSELPLNANAKVDRKVLLGLPLPSVQPDASEDGLEGRLVAIFQDVLKGRAVRADDDFARMGLDSLGAVRAARRIERDLGVTLPMGLLLRCRTIADMASALRQS